MARRSSGIKATEVGGLDEEQFAQDLALMLRSGLTLLDSLKTLGERAEDRRSRLIQQIMLRLREGDSLSAALQGSGQFNPALLACIRSSELTGDLPDSLQRYAANAARIRELRSKLVSALVYPVLLLGVAGMVVLFLLLFVVPRFAVVLEGAGKDLPLMSRILIDLGRGLSSLPVQVWTLLGALLALGVWKLVLAARQRRLEALFAGIAARIPGVRELVLSFSRGQFARSASMLVRSGVPALRAFGMCRSLLLRTDHSGLDRALASVSSGAPLASALHDAQIVDSLGLRVLRVSEQTGQLDTALDRLADIHEHDVERALERAGRLIEPVLMLGIGLVVGGIVVLMYLPIFQLAANVN